MRNGVSMSEDGRVIDLHAHPSMKTYLGDRKLTRARRARKGFAPLVLRTTYPALRAGGVSAVLSSMYVPERRLLSDCWLFHLFGLYMPRLREALREDDPSRIAHRMLDHVEAEVARSNRELGEDAIAIPRSYAELEAAEASGRLALLHTFEGAHVLAGDLANVRAFQRRGVCSITLAHFYPNGVAPPVNAVPADFFLRRCGCFRYQGNPEAGLTPLGHAVVEEMLEVGVLVDLTHCTPRARREAYGVPNPRARPLVMTHTGMATLRDHPLNASREDARAIAATGGVIGIIFYNHWLAGPEAEDSSAHVVRHARELHDLAGEDAVAFGSDFDGMTTPPDDLRDPTGWPVLRRGLERAGFTASQVDKFLGGNARRVLRDGWT
ncbi:MAG: dipeptidase [Gemmatimonadota bacterium]